MLKQIYLLYINLLLFLTMLYVREMYISYIHIAINTRLANSHHVFLEPTIFMRSKYRLWISFFGTMKSNEKQHKYISIHVGGYYLIAHVRTKKIQANITNEGYTRPEFFISSLPHKNKLRYTP